MSAAHVRATAHKILLIEDSQLASKVMQTAFAKSSNPPLDLLCRENLAGGLTCLDKERIDLVLLDLTLPDSSGLASLQKIQSKKPDLPILVFTGLHDEELAYEALQKGAREYLYKDDINPRMVVMLCQYAIDHHEQQRLLKQSNEELKTVQQQLIQAEKLKVVGRLAAGVAHEVKNPLAMIQMGIDYLLKSTQKDDQKSLGMLAFMSDALLRADGVIKEMLDFSTIQKTTIESQSLEDVIDKSLVLVQHEISRKKIVINMKIEENIPKLKIDGNRIEQVFINLLTNACHASQEGGKINITVASQYLTKPGHFVGYRKDDVFVPGDKVAIIEIKDSGSGIPEENISEIFDPFFTTRRAKGGSGLGLSVVKRIIDMHNGAIEAENCPEGGALIRFMLKIDK